jgi:hypothetical protein
MQVEVGSLMTAHPGSKILNVTIFSNQPCLQGPALTETDQTILDQRVESLEAFILDICIRYLLLHEIGNTDLFSEEQVAIAEQPQELDIRNVAVNTLSFKKLRK